MPSPIRDATEENSATSGAPYEASLSKAFDKLTSQIFIFLLAYVILLIGVAVFGSNITETLRNLFYIIPLLGVIAYVWLQHKEIVKNAKEKGIDVKAGVLSGSARVTGAGGVREGTELPENLKVKVGLARDEAEISGIVYGEKDAEASRSGPLEILIEIVEQLNKSSQIKLIANAQDLLDQQAKAND